MNDCPRADIRDLLPDWALGTLPAEARAAVAAHLATCDACSAEVELLRAARAELARVPAVDTARIAAAVVAAQRAVPKRGPAAWRSWRAVSGVALAASLIGVAVLTRNRGPGALPPDTTTPVVVDTGVEPSGTGQRATITPAAGRDLQLGPIGDLGDEELRALLKRLDRVDALPPESPEPVAATFVEGTP